VGALGPHIWPAGLAPKGVAAWHLAVALIDFDALGVTRAAVIDGLRARGIGSQVHYLPVPWQPYYRDRYGAGDYPGAAAYYRRILSLPLYPAMTIGDVDRVLDALDTVAHGR
jgi:dTDP-4-amino-4,6-dideoxygalactose transaminase